ncbi:STAS domain-containing protein [Kitasatospora cathayae]|uniref:Anti-sigma factor antagonist n=1 Tax=Kitasatospora cathayae TaxID=3004092 RepID=A0ABY7PWB8_9ACTN|nr:STAS domain-containing protein [Kitasatospora sp. HUAS 3-15]WBP84459.1 STAS domain-containing protein [Kitasatospora sp. HUAS 3-15]
MPGPIEVPSEGEQRSGGLRVVVDDRASVRVVTVAGELDHDSAHVLRAALARPLHDGVRRIVVDLAELRFCDSTGLNILLRARLDADAAGRTLEVARPQPIVARLFEVTGTDTVLRVQPDPDAELGPPEAADAPPSDPE